MVKDVNLIDLLESASVEYSNKSIILKAKADADREDSLVLKGKSLGMHEAAEFIKSKGFKITEKSLDSKVNSKDPA